LVNIFLRPSETYAIFFSFSGSSALSDDAGGEQTARENAVVTLWTQCDTRRNILIWIRRNPLKSPDSDE
jgi:hypothetical protein